MDVQPHLLNLSAYIDQNLEKDLPLSHLAKRVGLSPFHFHRKFGAYFGESLHQHIKRLRLERAAFSLIHGSTPVRQIAKDSGYKTVSAFSHAFSGFAGESPTRYRYLANSNERKVTDREEPVETVRLEPTWVGELAPQEFSFLRAMPSGNDAQSSVRDAVDLIVKLVGPIGGDAANDEAVVDAASSAAGFECIVATSDVYGIFKNADFRIDVGLASSAIRADRASLIGKQTLPGGRYARFDFRSPPDEALAQCRNMSLHGLQNRGETPRLSQYFLKFTTRPESDDSVVNDYRLFVPLTG